MAGGTGVAAGESLANGQKIDKSQVTVQNSVSVTNDFGTYTTSQSDVARRLPMAIIQSASMAMIRASMALL